MGRSAFAVLWPTSLKRPKRSGPVLNWMVLTFRLNTYTLTVSPMIFTIRVIGQLSSSYERNNMLDHVQLDYPRSKDCSTTIKCNNCQTPLVEGKVIWYLGHGGYKPEYKFCSASCRTTFIRWQARANDLSQK